MLNKEEDQLLYEETIRLLNKRYEIDRYSGKLNLILAELN